MVYGSRAKNLHEGINLFSLLLSPSIGMASTKGTTLSPYYVSMCELPNSCLERHRFARIKPNWFNSNLLQDVLKYLLGMDKLIYICFGGGISIYIGYDYFELAWK